MNQHKSRLYCMVSMYMAVLKLCSGQANTCDDNIPDIENAKPTGTITPPHEANTIIRYHCNTGFETSRGSVFVKCVLENNTATWVLSTGRCVHKSCGSPGNVRNGRRIGEDFRFGKNVTYKCNTGYEIVGFATIFCGANGDWTRSPPTCKLISCDIPPKPPNGSVRYTSLTYKSKANYTCDNSFHFVGSSDNAIIRECLANKTWSGSMPQCEEIQCPDLPEGPGFTITSTSSDEARHHVGKRIYFQCTSQPPQVTECKQDGKWSILPNCGGDIICIVPPLPPGIKIIHLHPQVQEQYKVDDVISYFCQSSGNRIFAKCLGDGTWSALPGHCEEVTTVNVTKPPPQSTEADDFKKPCGEAPQIEHGTVTYLDSQNAQYKCGSGFALKGSAVLKCLSSGMWNAIPPSCILGEKKFPIGLVIGITFGVVALIAGGIALGILLYKKKKSPATPNKKKASPNDAVTMEEIQRLEKNNKPVPVTVL